jgi:hypothetical protein
LFSAPFDLVVLAHLLRYPNPYARHVLTSDVISRSFDPSTQILSTVRLLLKTGSLPRWAPRGLVNRSEAWIIEVSEVDLARGVMNSRTMNLEHRRVMEVVERISVSDGGKTDIEATVKSDWRLLRGRIEAFGVKRFASSVERASADSLSPLSHVPTDERISFLQSQKGITLVLDSLRTRRAEFLESGPLSPFDFRLDDSNPSLEDLGHWKDVAGFSGYGVRDVRGPEGGSSPPDASTSWSGLSAKLSSARERVQEWRRSWTDYYWPSSSSEKEPKARWTWTSWIVRHDRQPRYRPPWSPSPRPKEDDDQQGNS